MRSISEKSLRAGSKLAAALLDEKGRVLVPAGTTLTDDVLSRVRRLARRMSLFIDDEVPENAADASDNEIQSSANVAQAPAAQDQPTATLADDPPSNQIGVDSLKVGSRTAQNLYDSSGVLLLAAGRRITPRFLFLLRQRRIRILHTTTPTAPVEPGERADEQPSGNCGQLDVGAMVAEIRRGLELHSRATVEVEQSFRALDACRADATNVLREIVDRFRQSMSLHRSLLAVLATLKQHFDEYLYDHCVNSALMTLTIGEQLGYQESMLRHVALAAICHDVGMLSVPDEIRLAPRRLTPDEQFEVHRHVQCAEQKLRGLIGLPEIVPTIVAQVHERGDGSGYPAGR
ncbi:MAG: HD domain-containing protein, partial [Planctomycetota bacterium]